MRTQEQLLADSIRDTARGARVGEVTKLKVDWLPHSSADAGLPGSPGPRLNLRLQGIKSVQSIRDGLQEMVSAADLWDPNVDPIPPQDTGPVTRTEWRKLPVDAKRLTHFREYVLGGEPDPKPTQRYFDPKDPEASHAAQEDLAGGSQGKKATADEIRTFRDAKPEEKLRYWEEGWAQLARQDGTTVEEAKRNHAEWLEDSENQRKEPLQLDDLPLAIDERIREPQEPKTWVIRRTHAIVQWNPEVEEKAAARLAGIVGRPITPAKEWGPDSAWAKMQMLEALARHMKGDETVEPPLKGLVSAADVAGRSKIDEYAFVRSMRIFEGLMYAFRGQDALADQPCLRAVLSATTSPTGRRGHRIDQILNRARGVGNDRIAAMAHGMDKVRHAGRDRGAGAVLGRDRHHRAPD